MADEKPRIIVDEDWKAQVEREKEALRQQAVSPPPQAPELGEMPPASLPLLISMFATEALMALGQIPNPMNGKHEADLTQATHLIDLLQVIEDKTTGNRTEEETEMLSQLLHQLRLAFVAVKKHLEGAGKGA